MDTGQHVRVTNPTSSLVFSDYSTAKVERTPYLVDSECRMPYRHIYSVSPNRARYPLSGGVLPVKASKPKMSKKEERIRVAGIPGR